MKNKMNRTKMALAILGLAAAPSMFAVTDTANTTLLVTVAAEATITVTASPTLQKSGTEFEAYLGDTTFTYKVRTSDSGTGSVTAQVTTPFDVASNITTADLSHVVAGSGVGTANTTSTTASAGSATTIVGAMGTNAHSSDGGDSATISWTLVDRPAYKTGSYSTVVTLTISAT